MIYAVAMLAFSIAGFVVLYALQRLQGVSAVQSAASSPASSQHLAFNTSISFITNTNWQSYVPETTMSYLTQMAGLTMHNFVSAATGIALAVALMRGFARRSAQDGRQFLGRSGALHALCPAADLHRRRPVLRLAGHAAESSAPIPMRTTLEGAKQTIAQGPVASQEAIKMLGTNGGGFFNANSAHPLRESRTRSPTSSRCC